MTECLPFNHQSRSLSGPAAISSAELQAHVGSQAACPKVPPTPYLLHPLSFCVEHREVRTTGTSLNDTSKRSEMFHRGVSRPSTSYLRTGIKSTRSIGRYCRRRR